MRPRFGWCWRLASAILLSSGLGRSADAPLAVIIGRVEAYYRNSPGITADFQQILETRTLSKPQQESGTVSLKPPGRIRWDYQRPRGKLALTDGRRAYLYLPEDAQVLVGELGDLEQGAVTSRLLLGTAPLAADFRIEGEPIAQRPGTWLLKLTPQAADFPYDAVTLEVEETTGAIRRIHLLDPLGNRIEYRFEHLRVVRHLPDKLFTYRIPKGVDIQVLRDGSGKARPSP